jgi:hypothetical protein
MSAIASLIAPYLAAMQGQPVDPASDPIYQGLFASALQQAALDAAASGAGAGGGGGYTDTSIVDPPGGPDVLPPDSPLLVSRGPVTLQEGALQALIQAARLYDLRPGAREIQLFGPGSTYRTPQQQANLYAQKPGVAAPPGHSFHQAGLAIDVPAALQTAEFFRLLDRLGWNQLAGEPWHWTYKEYG